MNTKEIVEERMRPDWVELRYVNDFVRFEKLSASKVCVSRGKIRGRNADESV